jgi:hypothetical protein
MSELQEQEGQQERQQERQRRHQARINAVVLPVLQMLYALLLRAGEPGTRFERGAERTWQADFAVSADKLGSVTLLARLPAWSLCCDGVRVHSHVVCSDAVSALCRGGGRLIATRRLGSLTTLRLVLGSEARLWTLTAKA